MSIKSNLLLQKNHLNQFKKQLKYTYKNNKIYKEKINKSNIKISDIKEITDINKLPLTIKSDFFIDYPYGFYAVDTKEIVRYHASSGTTGKPLIVGFTKNDINLRNEMIINICQSAGITKDDIIQICSGYGMFTGGLGFHEALIENGYNIIPTSAGNTEKQIFYMQKLHTTVLIASPSYVMHIYEVAKELGIDVKKLDVRILKLGSELLTDNMRKKIKEAWGNKIIINQDYGMTETMGPGLGSECEYHNGLHLYDKNFIYELVDPITKEPTDKNIGELVITNLYSECFPLIRYATNDIVELDYKKCKCGKTSPRIKRIIGRCDDMIKIKGVKVYLSQIEEFILKHRICTPNYLITLTTKDYIDDIKIEIEYSKYIDNSNAEIKIKNKEEELKNKFKNKFGIKANIRLISPNTLPRKIGKVKRIKDLRKNGLKTNQKEKINC